MRRCLPFALTSGRVRAFARGASVVLAVRGGPRLLFELGGHLSVELPAAYRGLTRGLCGNFNGNASDELQLQGPGPCAAPRPCPGSGCPPAAEDAGADAAGRGACGLLREPSGPLAPCHALLPPEPFFQACVADVGRARGNREVLCAFLQAYVAACQTAGADMRPWRAPSFCRMFPTRGLSELAGCGAGGGGSGRESAIWASFIVQVLVEDLLCVVPTLMIHHQTRQSPAHPMVGKTDLILSLS